MTQAVSPPDQQLVGFHRLLLRMAGRLPDQLITEARRWLAEGGFVETAQAVVFAALAARVPLTDADAALLADTLRAAGEEAEAVSDIERTTADPPPGYGLAPVSPEVLAGHGDAVPYSIDLTVPYEGPGAADRIDEAAVAAIRAWAGEGAPVTALWRAWRFPALATQWPAPRRMYLLQAGEEVLLPALVSRLGSVLEAAGETDPQIEGFVDPDELPALQRTALGFAALLWAAGPAVPIEPVPAYDTFDPARGPGFAPDHPRLDGPERDRVLGYLEAGVPLLITPTRAPDVVEPAAGEVVPTAFRTDGRWIWTDEVTYYLRTYRLAPDPALLDTIRANDFQPPEVDQVALHRALARLYASTAGGGADAATAGGGPGRGRPEQRPVADPLNQT